MIQSVKFDSSDMNIKNIANSILNFYIKEINRDYRCHYFNIWNIANYFIISYSPNDPNFIFPDNTEIKIF